MTFYSCTLNNPSTNSRAMRNETTPTGPFNSPVLELRLIASQGLLKGAEHCENTASRRFLAYTDVLLAPEEACSRRGSEGSPYYVRSQSAQGNPELAVRKRKRPGNLRQCCFSASKPPLARCCVRCRYHTCDSRKASDGGPEQVSLRRKSAFNIRVRSYSWCGTLYTRSATIRLISHQT